jgi:predicted glutamine amidotransferase
MLTDSGVLRYALGSCALYLKVAMCRLLGIVSSEPAEFRIVLQDSPRSLAALSREHCDGWGLAVYESNDVSSETGGGGWRLHKAAACAAEDGDFRRLASARGDLMLWHIRRRTIGAIGVENTHPFRKGRWVFAHNGTIEERDYLRASASARRLTEVQGQTDSEMFFAYLLTELDAAGVADEPASAATDTVIGDAVRRACAHVNFGAANFLLSDGTAMYAYRFGRTLFLLERGPADQVRPTRQSRDGTVIVTPWSQQRRAVLVASEAMTDEPWQAVDEHGLLRIDRVPSPRWQLLKAS